MLDLAMHVLQDFGATEIINTEELNLNDPTTEEEFKKLQYTSEKRMTWDMYQEKAKEKIPEIQEILKKVAKEIITKQCKKALEDSDYLMTVDNFETLTNGNEWKEYRKKLRSLPNSFDYDSCFFSPTQFDFQKIKLPQTPPISKETI